MNKRFAFAALLAAVIGAAGWYWFGVGQKALITWQGYADADFVKVGPTQQGLLTIIHVQRGDRIAAGAPHRRDQEAGGSAGAARANTNAGLAAKGLVRNAPDPADGRVRIVRITDKGQRALLRAVPLWRGAQAQVDKALGPEATATLNDLLDVSAARLRSAG